MDCGSIFQSPKGMKPFYKALKTKYGANGTQKIIETVNNQRIRHNKKNNFFNDWINDPKKQYAPIRKNKERTTI